MIMLWIDLNLGYLGYSFHSNLKCILHFLRCSSTKNADDPTFFFDAVAVTEVFGVISLLYDALQLPPQHRPSDYQENLDVIAAKLQVNGKLADIVLGALKLLNRAAFANLPKMQVRKGYKSIWRLIDFWIYRYLFTADRAPSVHARWLILKSPKMDSIKWKKW